MDIRFVPERPVETLEGDSLGMRGIADRLAGAVRRTRPPFVFGLLGDWGSGKTSILNLVASQLDQDIVERKEYLIPVRFDAWKYENEENLIYPLLHAIRKAYRHYVKGTDNRTFMEKFKQTALTATLAISDIGLRVASKALTGGEGISLENIDQYLEKVKGKADALESVLSGWTDKVDELENAFCGLLDSFAEDLAKTLPDHPNKEDIRFVILVDDLDRCLPENVVALLESIKNYLAVKSPAIFVLALNPQVVYQGIRTKYSNIPVDGRAYLEKILNYTFSVPASTDEDIQEFVTASFMDLVGEEWSEQQQEYFDLFSQAVTQSNFRNPRKIKRIMATYLLFLEQYRNKINEYHLDTIVRYIVLAEYYPAVFNQLAVDEKTAGDFISGFNAFANGKLREIVDLPGVDTRAIYTELLSYRELILGGVQEFDGKPCIYKFASAVNQIARRY